MRKILGKPDFIIGAITLALAIFLFVVTVVSFPKESYVVEGAPTESFLPRIVLAFLGACSITLMISGIRAKLDRPKEVKWGRIVRVVVAMALIAIYLAVVEQLELFFILSLLLIVSLMAIMGERDWKMLISIPLLYILLAYFVFFKVFGILFPTKIFI